MIMHLSKRAINDIQDKSKIAKKSEGALNCHLWHRSPHTPQSAHYFCSHNVTEMLWNYTYTENPNFVPSSELSQWVPGPARWVAAAGWHADNTQGINFMQAKWPFADPVLIISLLTMVSTLSFFFPEQRKSDFAFSKSDLLQIEHLLHVICQF